MQYAIIDTSDEDQPIYGIVEAPGSGVALVRWTDEDLFWAAKSGPPQAPDVVPVDELADGRYRPVAPAQAIEEGQTGGDIQLSEAWGKRFAARTPDGDWLVITDAYYVASDKLLNGSSKDVSPADCYIQNQVEYLRCTDLRDPGSTEVLGVGDITYETMPDASPTEADARAYAEALRPDFYDWQGEDV